MRLFAPSVVPKRVTVRYEDLHADLQEPIGRLLDERWGRLTVPIIMAATVPPSFGLLGGLGGFLHGGRPGFMDAFHLVQSTMLPTAAGMAVGAGFVVNHAVSLKTGRVQAAALSARFLDRHEQHASAVTRQQYPYAFVNGRGDLVLVHQDDPWGRQFQAGYRTSLRNFFWKVIPHRMRFQL